MWFPPIPQLLNLFKGDILIKIAKEIYNKLFSNNETLKDQKAFDTKNNSIDDIVLLNSALLQYRQEVKSSAIELENNIIKICDNVFEEVLNSLEFANQKYEFYKISLLEKKISKFKDNIKSIFARHTARRISLDDSDCIEILRMMPGELKGKRMCELKRCVFREAVFEIVKTISDFMNEFFETLQHSVESRSHDISDNIDKKINIFKELSLELKGKEESMEKIEISSAYILDMSILVKEVENIINKK